MRRLFTTLVFLLMCWSCTSDNKITIQCSDPTEMSLTMKPTKEYPAQYLVQFCGPISPDMRSWEVTVNSLNLPRSKCDKSHLMFAYNYVSHIHSKFSEKINVFPNCSHVCISRKLDMLIEQCYWFLSELYGNDIVKLQNASYADNNITKNYFRNTSTHVFTDDNKAIVITWYPGRIPLAEYSVEAYSVNATFENNEYKELAGDYGPPKDVTDKCSVWKFNAVRCVLPWEGCVHVTLQHLAPWAHSYHLQDLSTIKDVACTTRDVVDVGASVGHAWAWWCGGAAALVCALGAALYLCLRAHLKQLAARVWKSIAIDRRAQRTEILQAVTSIGVKDNCEWALDEGGCRVLLVYARDCPPVMGLVHALTNLIQTISPNPVIDLFSPEVADLAAGREAHWVREVVTAPHVRVVVLLTPAMAAVYHQRLACTHSPGDALPTLEEPLLSSGGAMYRTAEGGDTLVGYALACLATHALVYPHPYTKYLLATIEDVNCSSLLSLVVPYKRYPLPLAAKELLRDLDLPRPYDTLPEGDSRPHVDPSLLEDPRLEPHLTELATHAREVPRYIRNNPNYFEELLFFP